MNFCPKKRYLYSFQHLLLISNQTFTEFISLVWINQIIMDEVNAKQKPEAHLIIIALLGFHVKTIKRGFR